MSKQKKPYFRHDADAHNDPDILRLRRKHGWKGFGLYWFLIGLLRNSKGYKAELDYDNLSKLAQVRNKLVIPSIINDFDLFTTLNGMFWSERLMEDMKHMEYISAKARLSVYHRYKKQKVDGVQQISAILNNYTNRGIRT